MHSSRRIIGFTGVFFLFILLRAAFLQIIQYSYYNFLSTKNILRLIPLESERGRIIDASGNVIAEDKKIISCVIYPKELRKKSERKKVLGILGGIINVPLEELLKKYSKNKNSPVSIVVKESLSPKEELLINKYKKILKGVDIIKRYRRVYPHPYLFSNLVGYVGYIEKKRFDMYRKYGFSPPQRVGRYGLEEEYDVYLRGIDGGKQILVDALSRKVRTLSVKFPQKGKDIILTLDTRIQKIGYEILRNKVGALIFGKINGEILAMVSTPSFDNQRFIEKDRDYIISILNMHPSPLINRCFQGVYPPGSLFKIITSLAGLETGKIDISTRFKCEGVMKVGDRNFRCWSVHHFQDIISAIQNSCNIFFYKAGLVIGPDIIVKYAKKLGISEYTNISSYEKKGFLPSPSWKRSKGRVWTKGDTCNLSIGQGSLLVTPVQMFRVCSLLTSYKLVSPYIIKKIGNLKFGAPYVKCLNIKKKNIDIVKRGMYQAVHNPQGTAHILSSLNLEIAAKTGTAQTKGLAHGWVMGFFPYQEPKYIFVLIIEHCGSSLQACEAMKEFLNQLAKQKLINVYQ